MKGLISVLVLLGLSACSGSQESSTGAAVKSSSPAVGDPASPTPSNPAIPGDKSSSNRLVLPTEPGTPLPADPHHLGEIGYGDFLPMKSEPYFCVAKVQKADDGSGANLVDIAFSAPCNRQNYHNVVFTCQGNECDFAGRIHLHWIDNTQFTLSLSDHEAQEDHPPTATTYTTRTGPWFVDVCNRGAVRDAVMSGIKPYSCDRVYALQLAKMNQIFVRPTLSQCAAGIPANAFDGMLSLRRTTIQQPKTSTGAVDPSCVNLPIAGGALQKLNAVDGMLFLDMSYIPVEALRDLTTLAKLQIDISNPPSSIILAANSFQTLSGLRELTFSGEYIGLLGRDLELQIAPDAFAGLSSLEKLTFDGADEVEHYAHYVISAPPGAFADLASVTELNINQCDLSRFTPGAFQGLDGLTLLNIDSTILPKNAPLAIFTAMPKLQTFFLTGTSLSTVGPSGFAGLPSLQYLNLENGDIISIDPQALEGLPKLRHLDLDRNRNLHEIPVAALKAVPQLKELSLADTGLTSVPAGAFAGTPGLTSLGIDFNSFTQLPNAIFAPLANLERLSLTPPRGSPLTSISRAQTGLAAGVRVEGISVTP
jgi:Leucine-rich repeat (LRR) protein